MRKLRRAALPAWIQPAHAYLALSSSQPRSIWLDAGPNATEGFSYVGIPSDQILVEDTAHADVDIFERLREAISHDAAVDTSQAAPGGFALGWVGWLGYELASVTAGVPTADSPTPDAVMMYLDWALEFDHATNQVDLLVLGTQDDLDARLDELQHRLQHIPELPSFDEADVGRVSWRHTPEAYENLVVQCLESIRDGDAFQLCLTNQVTVENSHDPVAVYLRLRQKNPSHHGGLILTESVALLSSSPEVFLTVDEAGKLVTKPIKGTRKRGASQVEDAALSTELVENDKERAENLMIVDLMRNDVGRIAQLGSVHVENLLAVESYPHVHQLVSTVTAHLAPGLTAVDAAQACFPAGSMTGAPKISAMTILHRLEQGARGIYSGAFGYFGIDGAANLAMVIRSIVMVDGHAVVGTGGGITAGSIPRAEWEETRLKAAPLLWALGVESSEYS